MPATFTKHTVDTERKDSGTGGKPPLGHKFTGGGGNGDDDDYRNQRSLGPGDLLRRFRLGVLVVMAGDMAFFLGLAFFFYASRGAGHQDARTHEFIADWHPVTLPPILFLNTAVLLLSSLTMEAARRRIFQEIDALEEWLGLGRPALRKALPWLAATFFMGALFLAGQVMAWTQLGLQGFTFGHDATPASNFFYLITGFHALHLLAGVLALAFCLVGLRAFRRVEYRQIAVDSLAWFWHTMGLAWVLLFALIAFA